MAKFSQKQDLQRQSTKLTGVDGPQLELLAPSRPTSPVDKAYLMSLSSLRRAIRYSMSLSDLEPKEVYEPLGIDKATWSRIENGGMDFPASKLKRFGKITQNHAALMWLAHDDGFDLRPYKSELQAQLEQERAEKAELRKENDVLRGLLRR